MSRLLIGMMLWGVMIAPLSAASTNDEIEYLLNFVATSGCAFERNGNRYNAVEAREHIQLKYDYIKGRVKSAEDFIRYAATESSLSGRKYHATCGGKTITSEEWLTRELKRFRQSEN